MPVLMMQQPMEAWDKDNPKYQCCCQSCHVQTGVMIIGIIEAIFLGLSILISLIQMEAFIGSLINGIIWFIVLACLFWGLKTERASLLVPHLVLQVLGLILMGVASVAVIIGVFIGGSALIYAENEHRGQRMDKEQDAVLIAVGSAVLLVFVLGFALEIWFFLIVLACHRYFKDKSYQRTMISVSDFEGTITSTVSASAPNAEFPEYQPSHLNTTGYNHFQPSTLSPSQFQQNQATAQHPIV